MTVTAKKLTTQEAREHLSAFHVKRLNELAELDVKKEYAAAIVILQATVKDFNLLSIASHFQVAHEYFIDIENNIEQSVDGDFPVFAQLNELKMFMTAAWTVGGQRRLKQMEPFIEKMIDSIQSKK